MRDIDPGKLMKLVEERPELWDKSLYTYKDKYATRAAWREICVILKDDFQELEESEKIAYDKLLVAKWNHLRDNWVRHYKKVKSEKNSGTKTSKKYIYFEQMSFLKKIYDDLEGTSKVELSTSCSPKCSASKPKRRNSVPSSSTDPLEKRNKNDELEQKLLQILEKSTIASETTNPHMAFFVSLLPSLSEMTEEQVLEFRMDVLMSVKRIKQSTRQAEPYMKFESDDFCE